MTDLADIIGSDYDDIETTGSFEPIPAGDYRLLIEDAEWRDSRSGGRYVNLTMVVIEGEHEHRRIFDMLNLVNSNETAVKIAKQNLKSLCLAMGMQGAPQSIEDLKDKPFWAKVKIQPAKDGYDAKNRIAAYLFPSQTESKASAPQQASKPAAPQSAQSSGKMPWER